MMNDKILWCWNTKIIDDYDWKGVFESKDDAINDALIESIDKFGYTMKGFDGDGALLFGIEARTSSPVRIVRNEEFESNMAIFVSQNNDKPAPFISAFPLKFSEL